MHGIIFCSAEWSGGLYHHERRSCTIPEVKEWDLEATEANEEERIPFVMTITIEYKQNDKPSKNDRLEIFNKLGVSARLLKNQNKCTI